MENVAEKRVVPCTVHLATRSSEAIFFFFLIATLGMMGFRVSALLECTEVIIGGSVKCLFKKVSILFVTESALKHHERNNHIDIQHHYIEEKFKMEI